MVLRSTTNAARASDQTSLIAGTMFEGTKLPLCTWMLALWAAQRMDTTASRRV
ncbi:IS1595 transposase [Xanthomonas fragariae LMG 25863]|nr:IS1595 transposase [Xanthomonas fragariae LMG 25863]